MSKIIRIATAGSAWLLASCSTPFFADRLTKIDWSGPPAAGTIAVSQPKMYRRESLINERREEVSWLNSQLEASKIIPFAPELVRETEEIKQIAAALGLNFDPASAVNFRRDAETGNLQQQIKVLELQLQLDQLRRDATLMRAGFESQTAPLNADLGKVTSAGPTAASSPTVTGAAGQLTEAIDRINKDLATRLGSEAKAPASAGTSVNPGDVFRDRNTYRDLLKSARNAASLDDLHDYGGKALIRLNFQAMVLPESERTRAPGVVQMTVQKPELDRNAIANLYRSWLDHINGKMNLIDGTGWIANGELVYSMAADNFDLISYRYPLPQSNSPALKICAGLADFTAPIPAECGAITFAVPKFKAASVQEGAYQTLGEYLSFGALGDDPRAFDAAHARILQHALTLAPACSLPSAAAVPAGLEPDGNQKLMNDIQEAQQRAVGGEAFARIERQAQQMLRKRSLPSPKDDGTARAIALRTERAHRLLLTFEDAAYGKCSGQQRDAFRLTMPSAYVPQGFLEAVQEAPKIAVYEVGPREQTQQVSTVSRVANNLSLALSLAASKPGTGLGANAAANYSRQAFGRAATIERVPGLIGYATPEGTFGWVVGPKAVLDPKGTIHLEQTPRALDLSVELSVPGWWPSFTIQTYTGWGFDAVTISGGKVMMSNPQKFEVPMATNYADYDGLTVQLQRGVMNGGGEAVLDDTILGNQSVSACRATSLYLRGANIWRATSVIIGGHRLDDTVITVAPDMSGILLAVPPLDELVSNESNAKIRFSVFTRKGEASGKVDYVAAPAPGGCKSPEKPADSSAPAIATVTPVEFRSGSVQEFTIGGVGLGKADRITINGQTGVIASVSKDGKTLKAKFTAEQTLGLPISRTIALSLFEGDKKIGERLVENRH